MANQEHLNIFRQGVDGWNEWRKQHPEIRPDLTRANLGDAFLNRGDFIGTDLFGANLLWACKIRLSSRQDCGVKYGIRF